VRTVRGVTIGALALALVLVGCESDEPPPPIGGEERDAARDDAEETGLDDDASASDDEGDDEWAVPDEIDADYVERVVNHLLELERELFLTVLEEGDPPGAPISEEVEALSEQFRGPDLGLPMTAINEILRATPEIFDTDGDATRYHVEEVATADAACVGAFGRFEYRGLIDPEFVPDQDETTAVVGLVPASEEVDEEINPTGWVLLRATNTSDDPPPDPCEEQ
jgi:hypothetical protein